MKRSTALEFTKPQQVAFALRVREFRCVHGWTREDLGFALGISAVTVAGVEGAYRPSGEFVARFDELERRYSEIAAVKMPERWVTPESDGKPDGG